MSSRDRRVRVGLPALLVGAAAIGCASQSPQIGTPESELESRRQQVSSLEKTLAERGRALEEQRSEIADLSRRLGRAQEPDVAAAPPASLAAGAELLPTAKPGECFARVFVPPAYRSEEIQVLKREASSRIEIQPARYEWAEEQVLVKEAEERLEEERALDSDPRAAALDAPPGGSVEKCGA